MLNSTITLQSWEVHFESRAGSQPNPHNNNFTKVVFPTVFSFAVIRFLPTPKLN